MMRKIGFIMLLGLLFFICYDLNSGLLFAEENTSQQEAESTWEVHFGITRSWPKQEMANNYVHVIEDQVRLTAPNVARFEDWDDVYTGSISVGIGKKYKIPFHGKSLIVKPVVAFAYANGDINTQQNNLPTLLGVPMNYCFNQEYTFYRLEGGAEIDVFHIGPLTGMVAGYLGYNWFESDTKLDVDLGPMGSQSARGNFEDNDLGYTASFLLKYSLPVGTGWALLTNFRYEWMTLKADANVTETQTSPLGTTSNSYSMPFEVDLTGPVVGLFVLKEF